MDSNTFRYPRLQWRGMKKKKKKMSSCVLLDLNKWLDTKEMMRLQWMSFARH